MGWAGASMKKSCQDEASLTWLESSKSPAPSLHPHDTAVADPKVRSASNTPPYQRRQLGKSTITQQVPPRACTLQQHELDCIAASARTSHGGTPFCAGISQTDQLLLANY